MSTKLVKILAVLALIVAAPGTPFAKHGHGGHWHGGGGGHWHGGGYWRGGGRGWGGPNVYLDFGYPGYYAPDYYEPEECGWVYVRDWRYG